MDAEAGREDPLLLGCLDRCGTDVAPEWARRLPADGVDACLLVAT